MSEILNDFIKLDKIYCEEGDKSFEIIEGKGKILISAPHVVNHERNGKIRVSEPQTGTIAHILNKYCGCPVIIKRKNMGDDVNYDFESPYKTAIKNYVENHGIKLVIDLHQLSPKHSVSINLGTGRGKNLRDEKTIEIFKNCFFKHGIKDVSVDVPYAGAKEYTISSFCRKECKIDSCQVEINSKLLYGKFEEFKAENVCLAFMEFVKKIEG